VLHRAAKIVAQAERRGSRSVLFATIAVPSLSADLRATWVMAPPGDWGACGVHLQDTAPYRNGLAESPACRWRRGIGGLVGQRAVYAMSS